MAPMSGTFACPHCGAQYPVKPVLVGRAVRCTTCKNPFRLREDGIADKVEDAAPAATKPATASTPRPPTAAIQRPPASAEITAPTQTTTSAPNNPNEVKTDSRRARPRTANREDLEAQRKEMSANLTTAATSALAAESVRKEAVSEKKTTRRQAKKDAGRKTEGGVGEIGPVILTGYGETQHRNNVLWLIGSIGVIAFFISIVMLLGMRSDERKALDYYASVVEGDRVRYGERLLAIQERAWMTNVPAIVDLGDLTIHSDRTLSLANASELLSKIKGLTYSPTLQCWTPAAQRDAAERVWKSDLDRAANIERLIQAKATIVDASDVPKQLMKAGYNDDEAAIIAAMLTGQTNRNGDNWIADKLMAGNMPDAIQITPFSGKKGAQLVDLGRLYRQHTVDYSGYLLHFVGTEWPNDWKVFSIAIQSRE